MLFEIKPNPYLLGIHYINTKVFDKNTNEYVNVRLNMTAKWDKRLVVNEDEVLKFANSKGEYGLGFKGFFDKNNIKYESIRKVSCKSCTGSDYIDLLLADNFLITKL